MISWVLFVAKKVVSSLISPIGGSLLLSGVGMLWWRRRPERVTGKVLVVLAWLLLFVTSLPVAGHLLVHRLEAMAGPYAKPSDLVSERIGSVVVLGGDARIGDLSPADQAACSSLVRVLEGVRLWRELPGARLILSGGRLRPDIVTTAEAMARVARAQGVPESAILMEDKSWDTEDEAVFLKPVLGSERFFMVTSACHMPRAVLTFRRHGLKPIPAPADFEAQGRGISYGMFLPNANALRASDKAIREHFGMAVVYLKAVLGGGSGSL